MEIIYGRVCAACEPHVVKLLQKASSMSDNIPPATITALLPSVRAVLSALPPGERALVNRFWGEMRTVITEQDREIQDLRSQLGPQAPASRPQTSGTIDALRAVYGADMDVAGLGNSASDTVEAIWDMDPIEARQFIVSRRSATLEHSPENELGCWLSSSVPSHPAGYTKLNLRNTPKPDGSGTYGVQPWYHQLAVVATGNGSHLLRTSNGEYEVSTYLASW